jgi:hypothetical protein
MKIAAVALLLTFSTSAFAAPPRFAGGASSPPKLIGPKAAAAAQEEAPQHAVAQDGPHAHHISLFLGATTLEGHTHPTVGADYIYWLPVVDRVGLSPLVDVAFSAHLEVLTGLGVAMRAPWGLRLTVAPALVAVREEDGWHRHFVGRVNMGYDLHFGHFSAGPVIDADFGADHTAYVYGVAGGYGF